MDATGPDSGTERAFSRSSKSQRTRTAWSAHPSKIQPEPPSRTMGGKLRGELSARHRIGDLQVQDVVAGCETEMRDRLPVDSERSAEINVCAHTETTTVKRGMPLDLRPHAMPLDPHNRIPHSWL